MKLCKSVSLWLIIGESFSEKAACNALNFNVKEQHGKDDITIHTPSIWLLWMVSIDNINTFKNMLVLLSDYLLTDS